jgi:uncharacterized protein YyaL (SSP411 family)
VNRLAEETSPYLQQHADNPVDWWPWGPDAFAEAERRDVPILLSVGYAACHWCHVMAHESFEDQETAELVNALTVPVKVDREERPDVDAVYMEATQAMTGQGGWPMTVFCRPDGTPFFGGTYFPRTQFERVLVAVARAWRDQREAVDKQGAALIEVLGAGAKLPAGSGLGQAELDAAAARLRTEFDAERGGFGGAPKFPPSMVCEFLLRHHARTGSADSLAMVEKSCDAMARGGMYDQLAGGFARYSVDAGWVVPHFEKMLYDNALLLRLYAHLHRAAPGSGLAERVAHETARFLRTDLATAEGGFASALDADADGAEGLTYVWTPTQLDELLGENDGRWAAELLGVTERGTFEAGASVLQRRTDPDDRGSDGAERWAGVRERLLAARAERPQPTRDDKVVTAWNGLAIAALAEAGQLLDEPGWISDACNAAELLLRVHWVDGRLRRTSRDGTASGAAGVLEDYGCLAEGLLVLHQVTGGVQWLTAAGELLDVVLERFGSGDGGFYDTADDAERLVARPADPTDNATPSGSSSAAGALLTYAALTGSSRHRDAATAALARIGTLAASHPRFAGWACAVGEAALAGPAEVAVVGIGPEATELRRTAWASTSPGLVIVQGEPDADGIPLLVGRPLVDGAPAAYVCHDFVCTRPVTSAADLSAQLAGPGEVTR